MRRIEVACPACRAVRAVDVPACLTPAEAAIYTALTEANGELVSNQELLRAISGSGFGPYEGVRTHIMNLRAKQPPGTIENSPGRGYRLVVSQ